MTDRELLELAAKAAGYDVRSDGEGGLTITVKRGLCREWSPLTDDGDALRLAVKLHVRVSVSSGSCKVEAPGEEFRVNNEDERAATRRAIVMAAASTSDSDL